MALYTTDLCTGGTAAGFTNDNASAVDNNTATFAYATSLADTWYYQFATAKRIEKVRVYLGADETDRPNAYKIQGSQNGSDWTDLKSGNMANAEGWQDFTFTNPIKYLYVGIYVSTNRGGGWTRIYEVEMMEVIYTKNFPGVSDIKIF